MLIYIEYNKMLAGKSTCVRIFPNFILTLKEHAIVIEYDEKQHKSNKKDCESRRINRIQTALKHPNAVIDFNPDAYTNKQGEKIGSCFHFDRHLGCNVVNPKMQDEWDRRLEFLLETIKKDKEHPRDVRERITIHLFFDRYHETRKRKHNKAGAIAASEGTQGQSRKALSWTD